jgi:hypothetical protein
MAKKLEWTDVDSSMISAVAYGSERLHVRFKNGRVFSYDAPRDVFESLLSAESAGKFLNAEVKGTYDYHEEGGEG